MRNTSPSKADSLEMSKESDLWPRRDDPEVREELASRFLAFAKSIGIRYRGQAESIDDLVQVASLGLMNAIDRFDPSRGTPFMAYASPTIHGELKRHFRDRVSTLKVPRAVYERIGVMDRVVADLQSSLSQEPRIAEIADAMSCSVSEVLEARLASQVRNPSGFSDREEDNVPEEEHLGVEDKGFEKAEDRLVTGDALRRLNRKDRTIIDLRFRDELTQSEIADELGCSQMHVSRRLRSILDSLNQQIGGLASV